MTIDKSTIRNAAETKPIADRTLKKKKKKKMKYSGALAVLGDSFHNNGSSIQDLNFFLKENLLSNRTFWHLSSLFFCLF